MKKIIAIALIAVLVLSLAACGTINKAEVSILWSGEGTVKVPNSLINAMERAMYSEKISYKHYGANGDQAAQTKQAQDALNAGCAALAVELVDASAAQSIVDAAKAKNVPVVFFNCAVEETIVASYDKCVLVDTNVESLDSTLGELIASTLITEKKGLFAKEVTYSVTKGADRNNDGTITYLAIGDAAKVIEVVNAKLTEAGLSATVSAGDATDATVIAGLTEATVTVEKKEMGILSTASGAIDLIITNSDAVALEVLTALQERGYNSTKLTTHNIPMFTVGTEADAKDFTNTSNMSEEEKSALIYTVTDIIGAGQITGTATEDYDGIAVAVATVLRNLLKGNDTFKDISTDIVNGIWAVKVPYTTVSSD